MPPSLFVTKIDADQSKKLQEGLIGQGFTLTRPPHTKFQAKKLHLCCTLYESGKLVVQGKEMAEFVEFYLEPEILGTFTFQQAENQDFTPHIGVDESGKGDYFGPLCIAGVYADEKSLLELKKWGIKDSKRLKDPSILKIADQIRKRCPHHIVRIGPRKYNELYEKFGNLNLLLGWGHATVIEQLVEKTGCTDILIDKFAADHVVQTALAKKGKEVTLTQKTQGEQDIVVAAASILARAAFVRGLEALEKQFSEKLPKGANGHILQIGKQLVRRHGPNILEEVGKLHFKTTKQILE